MTHGQHNSLRQNDEPLVMSLLGCTITKYSKVCQEIPEKTLTWGNQDYFPGMRNGAQESYMDDPPLASFILHSAQQESLSAKAGDTRL